MSIRVITPSGAVREYKGVLPIVEKAIKMNGTNILMREKAKSLAESPTGLLFIAETSRNCFDVNKNLYVGNLPEEQIKSLLENICNNGILRLCDLSYQKARLFEDVRLVPGTYLPYTNEYTRLVEMNERGSFVMEPQLLCYGNTFAFCGGGAESEDESDDEDDSEDDDELPLRDGIDITRPVSDEEFEERGEYQ